MSSSSSRQPAEPLERITISSRPQSTQPTPTTATTAAHPQETVFDEDEETESFYVVLDISGDDFAAYGKYRDGRKFRPRLGDRYYEDDNENDPEDGGPAQSQIPDDERDPEDEEEDEEDLDEDDEDNSTDNGSLPADDDEVDAPRELALQILDLDTREPLVNYEGKIYTCKWTTSHGTEMLFEPPVTSSEATESAATNNNNNNNSGHINYNEYDEEEEEGMMRGNKPGRKLKTHQESKLFCTTVHRLEGWPGKLRPRGRDKQEVSTKARMFAERLDAVLEHRIGEMMKNKEDVSDVTMKKFSEGQQAPGGAGKGDS
ncbi:hypothetical protein H072_8390 [Dactylellina haptotyla CBS 200.50]|uniref:Transcription factor TFIIIC triple barrel domain-containing protein n=1 Tax=Dactylellina haptotyla (strain CBS 200.50) TaxID=1284197 RepID=S8A9Q9_DACHA|nr:hypothetical protein H072_8390 [Dactylellina haptotyla CBS 200.50]